MIATSDFFAGICAPERLCSPKQLSYSNNTVVDAAGVVCDLERPSDLRKIRILARVDGGLPLFPLLGCTSKENDHHEMVVNPIVYTEQG